MNETNALQNLPHGPEFRFIDRVITMEPGKAAVGEYKVRGDEPFLKGHFPDNPIFPGVLLIEAAAQLAGIVAQCTPDSPALRNLRLTAVRNVKIFGTARPGETISVEAQLSGRFANLVQATTRASVADKLVMQAEVTLSGES